MLYPKNPPYPETWVEFPYYEYPMIAKHYMVSNYGFIHNTITNTFNEDQIRIICKYMEDHGKSSSSQEILSLFGLDYHSMDKKQKMKYASVISDIRNKRTFVNICNEYNY